MEALLSLTALATVLGFVLALAARRFAVENDPRQAAIEAILPGTNCGQCGYPGCAGAAAALLQGQAAPTLCPPGGRAVATQLAQLLGVTAALPETEPCLAMVEESLCIGCCRCLKHCPTDAIVGAAKQINGVLPEACTACGACVDHCPTGAIELKPLPVSLSHWVWPKPAWGV